MIENHGPDEGQLGQSGNGHRREGLHIGWLGRLTENESVTIKAQAGAQHGDAKPGDVLAESQGDGEQAHERAEYDTRRCRRRHPQPQAAAEIGHGKAAHGAEQHDAFDAEIEHAGAFAEHLADGGAQ